MNKLKVISALQGLCFIIGLWGLMPYFKLYQVTFLLVGAILYNVVHFSIQSGGDK